MAHTPTAQTETAVIAAMETYGGSFVKALAECFNRADAYNFAKLKAAFPDIWQEYAELAALAAKDGQ